MILQNDDANTGAGYDWDISNAITLHPTHDGPIDIGYIKLHCLLISDLDNRDDLTIYAYVINMVPTIEGRHKHTTIKLKYNYGRDEVRFADERQQIWPEITQPALDGIKSLFKERLASCLESDPHRPI